MGKVKKILKKIAYGLTGITLAGLVGGPIYFLVVDSNNKYGSFLNMIRTEVCGSSCTDYYIEKLQSDDEEERYYAVRNLGMIEDKDATEHLLKGIDDESVRVRQASCYALSKIMDKGSIPFLKKVVKDPFRESGIRSSCARALHKMEPYTYFNENFGEIEESRDALINKIQARLEILHHTYREVESDFKAHYKQIFSEQKDNLDIIELNQILAFLDEFQQQDTLTNIGNLVKKDLQLEITGLEGITKEGGMSSYIVNTSNTELGGLVKIIEKDGKKRLAFVTYEPLISSGNGSYFPNNYGDIDGAVCNFHLHAIDINSSNIAGPSIFPGDLTAANSRGRNGIVITPIGLGPEDNIFVNIDYYTGKFVSVDLGNYDTGIQL